MDTQAAAHLPFKDLPEGTVTFLFCDIEGSTQLLYRLGDQFTATLNEHHTILREAVTRGGGQVVRTEGDAFFVVFPRARNAVSAAVEAQCGLAQYAWPEGVEIRVRMGLHTGEAEVALDDYVGIAVHKAARIAHVGHGGQVLLSETTAALVKDDLPIGVSLLDLGRHLLKDIRRPEQICQLVIEGLPSEFPPLKTLGTLPPEGARLPRPVRDCPYRGLAAFREVDAPFYCGRETFVSQLEETVRRQALTIVVVGSSGSGKSSALFAGLLPRLRQSGNWQFALLRPGSQPFYALAGALLPLLEPGLSKTDMLAETRKLAERFAHRDVSLAQVIDRIRQDSPESLQLLLVVDQFEELYTLCSDTKTQQAFIDELLSAKEASQGHRPSPCVILLTLRADFMGQALAYRPFADALQEGSLLMGPMTRQELHTAIEKPAEMQGAAFEAGLVERILDDVGDKPGSLPLLEFTLTQLWEQQSDGWLTHMDYEAMGSVEGALAAYADQVYVELELGEQEQARLALVQLVQPGEGTEDTRRVASREELGEESWKLIQHLANKRLVVTGRDAQGREIAEVVHETLIQRWGRVQDWMDADRTFRIWQEQLRGNLRQWKESGEDEGALLGGVPLLVAENWLNERSAELSEAEQGFIQRGIALREQHVAEREAARLRELEAAQKLAESERQRAEGETHSARQLRQRAYYLAGILFLAIMLAVAAFLQRNAANREAHLAAARELALASISNLNKDAELSILLALQAVSESNSANVSVPTEVQDALHRAIQNSRIQYTLTSHEGQFWAVAYSPDGNLLATAGDDKTARIWDAATGKELIALPGHTQTINDIVFSPDGRYLATASDDKTVKLWNVQDGKELYSLNHDEGIWSVSFSADGVLLATAGSERTNVWDVNTRQLLKTLEGQNAPIAFSPSEKLLATTSDGTTEVWNVESVESSESLLSLPYAASALVFSPDGKRLATARTELKVWDVSTGEELVNETGIATVIVSGIDFNPDGSRIATASQDGTTAIWDSETGKRLFALAGHSGAINDVAFNPQCVAYPESPFEWCGVWLATASRDGTAKVWDVSPAGSREVITVPGVAGSFLDETRLFTVRFTAPDLAEFEFLNWTVSSDGHRPGISRLARSSAVPIVNGFINPDGTRLVTLDIDSTLKVWDTQNGKDISTFEISTSMIDPNEFIPPIALSPNGTQMVTGDKDGTVKVWDVATGKELLTLKGNVGPVYGVIAFSLDGTRIATGGDDGTVKIWDASTGRELLMLRGHTSPVYEISFSADGKRIASGGMDPNAIIWDATSGEKLFTLKGHTASINAVAFSPDGSLLITGSNDTTVKIWDTIAGRELLTLIGHNGFIFTVAISPDGKLLATGSFQDNTVRVYALDVNELARLARSRLTRSFTLEECEKYLHQTVCP